MNDVAVIVATHHRPNELEECLRSLLAQSYPAAEIVVVDDAPGGDLTPAVVARCAAHGPVRYVAGKGAGLAAAHNVGLRHVTSPLIAFTDDDVLADRQWLAHLVTAFGSANDVACVTGRIMPRELITDAQIMLEGYAAFNKGPTTRVFDLDANRPDDALYPLTAGRFGSGANMAFTRSVLQELGGFDPALGAGTRARGGDDLAAFFEVIQRGHRLVYEPQAVVLHRHAEEVASLRRQVYGYGVGATAYLTKCVLDRPALVSMLASRLPSALAHLFAANSPKNARLPSGYPRELVRLERMGMLVGPFAYLASRRQVARRR